MQKSHVSLIAAGKKGPYDFNFTARAGICSKAMSLKGLQSENHVTANNYKLIG